MLTTKGPVRAAFAALASVATAVAGGGCGIDDLGIEVQPTPDAGVTPTIDEDCNPLDEQACLLPWPSAMYLEEDASTATGLRVALPEGAMPVNRQDVRIDPAPFNRRDGFPATGSMLASFPTGVSPDGLPPVWDIGASLAEDAPIVLLDMDSGTRQPYFAEVDANEFNSERFRALIIRPVTRLTPGTRYAVAITDRVRGAGGEPLPVSPAFRALRDGEPAWHPRVAATADRFEEVFEALEAQGIERGDLVLAWDFVTASSASVTAELLAMREQARPAMGEAGEQLGYELELADSASPHVLRRVIGTFEAPNFLTDAEEDASVLIRDAEGLPVLDGVFHANLTAIIPRCAEEAELPLPVALFGHGLLASAREHLEFQALLRFADEACYVVIGTDWIGLTSRQIPIAPQASGDANRLGWIVEKLAQGVINFIALQHIVRGPLAEAEEFQLDGEPLLDGASISYVGMSLGGIMGAVLMNYDEVMERAALGVPGGPWGVLLERSAVWNVFQGPLINAYGDQLRYQVVLALGNMLFEFVDPLTTAPNLLTEPIGGAPPKQILMYNAFGDSIVTNVGTYILARSLGVPVIGPTVELPWGLEVVEDAPSGLTVYDQGFEPLPPMTNVPPEEDNGTHLRVNFLRAPARQIQHFAETGVVRPSCFLGEAPEEPVPCDCTTGACD
jgi:hypothetical protein